MEKERKVEEEVHNFITPEIIQSILDQEDTKKGGEQQAHSTTENETLMKLIKKLPQKVTSLESGKGNWINRNGD